MTIENQFDINNRIHFVFVPVRNMGRAVEFYSSIFGLEVNPGPYGSLYNLEMMAPNIVLDSNIEASFEPSKHPLFSLKAIHLESAHLKILQAGGSPKEIVSFGETSFFVFEDPDGNKIMVVNN